MLSPHPPTSDSDEQSQIALGYDLVILAVSTKKSEGFIEASMFCSGVMTLFLD